MREVKGKNVVMPHLSPHLSLCPISLSTGTFINSNAYRTSNSIYTDIIGDIPADIFKNQTCFLRPKKKSHSFLSPISSQENGHSSIYTDIIGDIPADIFKNQTCFLRPKKKSHSFLSPISSQENGHSSIYTDIIGDIPADIFKNQT